MDHIPSQSISKSVLIVTPLFLLVLAVLHSSSQLSYLFILKFINNVAGSADITFLPSLQPQIQHSQFNKNLNLQNYQIYQNTQLPNQINIPFINISSLQTWSKQHTLIKGISPRWMVPSKIGTTDIIILVLNIPNEINLQFINKNILDSLTNSQIAMQLTLMNKLGLTVNDHVSINIQPKNLLNGLKLFQKFQDFSSDQQYKTQFQDNQTPESFVKVFFKLIQPYTNDQIQQQQLEKLIDIVWNSQTNLSYTLKQGFYPQGIYPSAINSVVMMQFQGFINLLTAWIIRTLLNIVHSDQLDIRQHIPIQYQIFIPINQRQLQSSSTFIKNQLKTAFDQWSLLIVCKFNKKQQIYHPKHGQVYQQFVNILESIPGNVQSIVIYPFFEQSLAIKYFFDSVIQIFQFVTCIIYYYTMTLILKQVYQQKQVQVGIWRTLGAGGLPLKKKQTNTDIELQQKGISNQDTQSIKYRSQFQSKIRIKQKIIFIWRLAYKVGFAPYWAISTIISVILYCFAKFIIYVSICSKLGFETLSQPLTTPMQLFAIILVFIFILVFIHIKQIYTNPLSETIKPVKRTFDVVKVRVIHVATFGVTIQVLLIAIMLVYYGVVSYYWIPFAVLDDQQDLQVLLFNTIFLFMIFGSIILLSIFQSRLQVLIFKIIFNLNNEMKCMKLAILKNIKAKQYKNIKVGIIISIIFAFVLFFTAGIKIQIQIVQSFIQRALGSNLVFQNYQKNTFNRTLIDEFLNNKQQISYAWLSKSLSRDNVSIKLISHISGTTIDPQFQVLTSSYLNSSFYQYYYPEEYLPQYKQYWQLPNSIYDGFNSIYKGDHGQQSVGTYDPQNTISVIDPYNISVNRRDDIFQNISTKMAPNEQVIRLVVSTRLQKQLGIKIGDYYKMQVQNTQLKLSYYLRAQITHSFKAGPGFDILGSNAFISQQQASYIYHILQINQKVSKQNQKLFIKGTIQNLKGLGSSIISMAPQHTQMFQVQFVSQSFSLLQKYLNFYVVLITCIMSILVTIFIFLYTLGKCREEAEMYKMLRAIGLSAKNIRIMVFFEILIRLIVSLIDGILLGLLFSIGFSLQIQQFLMIKVPEVDITIVSIIGLVLIFVFSITIIRATRYIALKTVAETNRI